MPKVSVVIPTYNSIAYLPTTVQSVLQQTFTDWELIIVNDGSTDQTVEWVKTVADPRVRLISQANAGVAEARNTGLHHAQGEYIAFLDADDVWEPTKLEKQVPLLDRDPQVGLVDTAAQWIDHHDYLLDHCHPPTISGNVWPWILEANTLSCGSTALVRRVCFEALGGFDQAVSPAEDWDMWIRIATCYRFAAVDEILVYYRQHPASASRNYTLMEQQLRRVIAQNTQRARQTDRHFGISLDRLNLAERRAYCWLYQYLAWKHFDSGKTLAPFQAMLRGIWIYPVIHWVPAVVRLIAFTVIRSVLGSQGLMQFRASTRRQMTQVSQLETQWKTTL